MRRFPLFGTGVEAQIVHNDFDVKRTSLQASFAIVNASDNVLLHIYPGSHHYLLFPDGVNRIRAWKLSIEEALFLCTQSSWGMDLYSLLGQSCLGNSVFPMKYTGLWKNNSSRTLQNLPIIIAFVYQQTMMRSRWKTY